MAISSKLLQFQCYMEQNPTIKVFLASLRGLLNILEKLPMGANHYSASKLYLRRTYDPPPIEGYVCNSPVFQHFNKNSLNDLAQRPFTSQRHLKLELAFSHSTYPFILII